MRVSPEDQARIRAAFGDLMLTAYDANGAKDTQTMLANLNALMSCVLKVSRLVREVDDTTRETALKALKELENT